LDEIFNKVRPIVDEIFANNQPDDDDGDSCSEYFKKFSSLSQDKLLEEKFLVPIGGDNYALNFSDVAKFVAPKLHKMYANPDLYSSSVMFEPPAERQPNVLRLQLTD